MAGLQEINSFVNKFVCLWSEGIQAKLVMETESGKASVNLHANLELCPLHEHNQDGGRRVGGCRLRRRERRAAARQLAADQVAKAEEAMQTKEITEKVDEDLKAAEIAVTIDESNKFEVEETLNVSSEEVDTSVNNDADTIAEKALSVDEMEVKDDNDFDIYIFRYGDNINTSKAQDALKYIEKTLKQNFKNSKVKDSDQIYKVDEIKNLYDNEIQVKVKLKKNNWSVERSARNVQTASQPGDPVSVSIKSFLR